MKFKSLRYIAAVMLLIAIGGIPYAYYTLLRWVICISSIIMIAIAVDEKKIGWQIIFGLMALLFNPLLPIHLNRDLWFYIDCIGASIFFISNFSLGTKPEEIIESTQDN